MTSCVQTHGALAYSVRMHSAMVCYVRIHITCTFRVGSGMYPARVHPEHPEYLVHPDTDFFSWCGFCGFSYFKGFGNFSIITNPVIFSVTPESALLLSGFSSKILIEQRPYVESIPKAKYSFQTWRYLQKYPVSEQPYCPDINYIHAGSW